MAKRWDKNQQNVSFYCSYILHGIVKKDLITSYWSTGSTIATLFPRTVMSRNEFENIFVFLHCCDNSEYATKGQPGYNPKSLVLLMRN